MRTAEQIDRIMAKIIKCARQSHRKHINNPLVGMNCRVCTRRARAIRRALQPVPGFHADAGIGDLTYGSPSQQA